MKKFTTILISLLVAATSLSAQTTKETIKERKMIAKQSQAELNAKASKAARKEAKNTCKGRLDCSPRASSIRETARQIIQYVLRV